MSSAMSGKYILWTYVLDPVQHEKWQYSPEWKKNWERKQKKTIAEIAQEDAKQ